MTGSSAPTPGRDRGNVRVAVACVAVFAGMVGLSFASVPLYDLFCKVTGYEGTTRVAESNDGVKVLDRTINVRFDANTSPGLPWTFAPEVRQVKVRIGELGTVKFKARNVSDKPVTGQATYNVTPDAMGAYFSKIACFCFTEQTLKPGEEIEMPVTFYVDPGMVDDADTTSIQTVTLSYTFFQAVKPPRPVAAVAPAGAAKAL